MLTWSRATGLRGMVHSPGVRIEPGKRYSTKSVTETASPHARRRPRSSLVGDPRRCDGTRPCGGESLRRKLRARGSRAGTARPSHGRDGGARATRKRRRSWRGSAPSASSRQTWPDHSRDAEASRSTPREECIMATSRHAPPKFETVLYEKKGPICYITLNRPEKLNAATDQLV